jgi:hypothetical protein
MQQPAVQVTTPNAPLYYALKAYLEYLQQNIGSLDFCFFSSMEKKK